MTPLFATLKASQLQDSSMAFGKGPFYPPPPPAPAVTLPAPPFPPPLPCCRLPEASGALAKDGGQPDGPGSRDGHRTSTSETVPHTLCPGATPPLPASWAWGPGSAASLRGVLESTGKHGRRASDLPRPGRQGRPKLFLPGTGCRQRCQIEEGTADPQLRASAGASKAEALVSGSCFSVTGRVFRASPCLCFKVCETS